MRHNGGNCIIYEFRAPYGMAFMMQLDTSIQLRIQPEQERILLAWLSGLVKQGCEVGRIPLKDVFPEYESVIEVKQEPAPEPVKPKLEVTPEQSTENLKKLLADVIAERDVLRDALKTQQDDGK